MDIFGTMIEAPVTNTVDKDTFEQMIGPVFKHLEDVLGKSFGPYGANSFISSYPYISTTKDGFSIMKQIKFKHPLHETVAQLAKDICGRLNNTVGDGTTSSIIATNAMYESYKSHKEELDKLGLLPRDIVSTFHTIADEIVDKLSKDYVQELNPENPDFEEKIRNVIYISSNGDEELTNMLVNMYTELKSPAIDIVLAPDGITKTKITNGYPIEVLLTDELYVNSDNKTATYDDIDILVFDHKVTMHTYEKIIQPLNEQCRARGRHLAVIAPYYDEHALGGLIRQNLLGEYRRSDKKDINLVLACCSSKNGLDKKKLSDFAMLLNTSIITESAEEQLIDEMMNGKKLIDVIDMDHRGIPDIKIFNGEQLVTSDTTCDEGDIIVRLGFCRQAEFGLKKSVFRGFYPIEELYNVHMNEAKRDLEESVEKYKKMGTFNLETTFARQRLYALKLKMGSIEVGGDSQLSQEMLRDTVDDAVKASASAYSNGVVLGCHVCMLNAINDLKQIYADKTSNDCKSIYTIIIDIIRDAYRAVYRKVLSNKFDSTFETDEVKKHALFDEIQYSNHNILGTEFSKDIIENIIDTSVNMNKVFDLTSDTFKSTIINSAETDIQILRATIDLTSLLISGNQLVFLLTHGEQL